MTGLLLSNLDASTTPYHTGPQDGMPWFAILNKDYSPRPAWKAIKSWREGEGAVWATKPQAGSSSGASNGGAASNGASASVSGGSTASAQPSTTASPVTAASPTPDASTLAAQPPTPSPESTQMVTAEPSPAALPAASPSPSSTTTASDPGPVTAAAVSTTRLRVGKTDGTGANLRDRPISDGTVLAILMDGTGVDIVGDDVKAGAVTWRNVRTVGSTTDGVTGWVASQYLVP
jgi:hypothetical protein